MTGNEHRHWTAAEKLQIIEEAGQSTTLSTDRYYNGLGQLLQEQRHNTTQVESTIVNYEYNAQGLQATAYVPYTASYSYGYRTPVTSQPAARTAYDGLGRVVMVTNTDGTTVTTAYDGLEQIVRDENGHQIRYSNDGLGRLTMVREYTGTYTTQNRWTATAYATTTYTYDGRGLLTSVKDAKNNVTSIVYDLLERKTVMTDTDMGVWHYYYNLAGNLTGQVGPDNLRLRLEYDALNRLTVKRYCSDANDCPSANYAARYWYDSLNHGYGRGHMTSMSAYDTGSVATSTWRKWDERGRIISETISYTGGPTATTEWTYNTRDQNNQIKYGYYPSTDQVTVGYDNYGRPTSLTGWTTYQSGATYDALDRLTGFRLANGTVTKYVYNPFTTHSGRLAEIRAGTDADATSIVDLDYDYDNAGDVMQITDSKNAGQTQSFGYDALNRLTSAATSQSGAGQYSHTYSYDKIGNITATESASYLYTDTAHVHAVTAVETGMFYSYDARGNQTRRDVNGVVTTYSYDREGRLLTVRGNVSATFTYDGEGRLAKSVVGGVTSYFYNQYGEQVGGTAYHWLWLGGRRVARGSYASGVTYLYGDQLGSTVATRRAVTNTQLYEAYGLTRGSGAAETSYQFTGQRSEPSLGLYDYGARWYDPSTGLFIQPDSIVPEPGNPQSLNRYSYALNNPMRYTDPTGHAVKYEDDYMPNTGMQYYRRAWDFYEGRLPSKEEWIRDSIYKNSTDVSAPRQGEWQAYLKMRDIVGADLIQYVGSQEKFGIDSVVKPIAKLIERLSGSPIVNPVGDGFGYIATSLPEFMPGIALGHTALMSPKSDTTTAGLAEEYVHHLQQHADPLFPFHYAEQGFSKWPGEHPFSNPNTSHNLPSNSYELQGRLVQSLATSVSFSGNIWYFQP